MDPHVSLTRQMLFPYSLHEFIFILFRIVMQERKKKLQNEDKQASNQITQIQSGKWLSSLKVLNYLN